MKFTTVLATLAAFAGLTLAAPTAPSSSDLTALESTNTAVPASDFLVSDDAGTSIEERSADGQIARRWNYDFSRRTEGFTFEVDKFFQFYNNGKLRKYIIKESISVKVWWATGNNRMIRAPEPAALPGNNDNHGNGNNRGNSNNGQHETTVKEFTLIIKIKDEVFINGRPFKTSETIKLQVIEITQN